MSEQKTSCAGCAHEGVTAHEEPCRSCTNWKKWSSLVKKTCETCDNYNCHEEGCSLFPDQCVWVPALKSESFTPALDDLKKTIVLTPKYEIKAKQLADEHWAYVKSVLDTHVSNAGIIGEIGFHYKSAFVHGYKHGKEDS